MKAVILAGGRGTRLAPYTTVLPKPLLPLGQVPILEIILRQLERHRFSRISLACGHLGELIRAYLDNKGLSERLNIDYYWEEEPLGTAGALASMKTLDERFLVMNGDILTTLDYSALVNFHIEQQAALTIAVTSKEVQIELGILQIDQHQRVVGYTEKPVEHFPASTGIYVYEPRVLTFIEAHTYLDFPTLVMRLVEAGESVAAYRTDAFWLDMGNKGDYETATKVFEDNPERFIGRYSMPLPLDIDAKIPAARSPIPVVP